MTRCGYLIWQNALRPILVKAELQFEPQKDAGSSERNNETSSKLDTDDRRK